MIFLLLFLFYVFLVFFFFNDTATTEIYTLSLHDALPILKPDFWTYRMFCKISQSLGMNSFCFQEMPFGIQALKMASQFSIHIWTSIYAGIILAFPYIIYEFWKFISPGLKENERKSSQGFIIFASVLFFIGVIFGYYVITPLSIN